METLSEYARNRYDEAAKGLDNFQRSTLLAKLSSAAKEHLGSLEQATVDMIVEPFMKPDEYSVHLSTE
ncbi:MAG: hypothetical protein AABW88_02360 [Nanoarchaeota archaeon]